MSIVLTKHLSFNTDYYQHVLDILLSYCADMHTGRQSKEWVERQTDILWEYRQTQSAWLAH